MIRLISFDEHLKKRYKDENLRLKSTIGLIFQLNYPRKNNSIFMNISEK